MSDYDGQYQDVYENGLDAIDLSGDRKGGKVILPNYRLAILWRKIFAVQFTDGGWMAVEDEGADRKSRISRGKHQLEHPFAYARAEIEIDNSRKYPLFESYTTHEKIGTPIDHFDRVPDFFTKMVDLISLVEEDYDKDDLMDDLKLFDNMEFHVNSIKKCSTCNPDIY